MLHLQAPWGAAIIMETKTEEGQNPVNKAGTKGKPTGTANWSSGTRDRTTKSKGKCKFLCRMSKSKSKQETAAPMTTDSGGLTSLWLLIWQESNNNNNTNNKSALTKRFKTNKGVGLHKNNNDNRKTNDKKTPDGPPEGSWWTKVPLGRVLS